MNNRLVIYGFVVTVFTIAGCGLFRPATDEVDLFAERADFPAYSQQIPGTEVLIDMVPIPGGTFMMGRSSDEPGKQAHEGPKTEVTVDPFWMSKHEITWEQYDLFASQIVDRQISAETMAKFGIEAEALTAPSAPYGDATFGMGRDNRPAIGMTHYAAVIYAMWITAVTGEFHRLPTEAEWEFACRAGSETSYYFDANEYELDDFEWHAENSNRSYQGVAAKKANPFGLHDMMGNIAEWTMDEFHEDYHERIREGKQNNPWFNPEVLYPRTIRGGSFRDQPDDIRCTTRRGSDPRWSRGDPQIPRSMWWHTNAPFVGFRLVRPKEAPPLEEIEEFWIMPILDI
ncbi:SUMF1/EgtB/PvdO family nonheme iron enzyme [Balneolaceae bacterium ANBcel3]|nr:SUMF1/EgtB/PvdO family nonheme iron enzyme [Balneolaceae bacterium ANBcel3]